MLTCRPKVAELVYRLYGRPLHPELFAVCASRVEERADVRAKVDITSAGHVITWTWGDVVMTEVAASGHQPLPEQRRLIADRLSGQEHREVHFRRGVQYEVDFQLDKVKPEVFWNLQEQMASTATDRQGFLYEFTPGGRMALGAMSYVHFETRRRRVLVQAMHTFPDDYAIVKTQSTIILPSEDDAS